MYFINNKYRTIFITRVNHSNKNQNVHNYTPITGTRNVKSIQIYLSKMSIKRSKKMFKYSNIKPTLSLSSIFYFFISGTEKET